MDEQQCSRLNCLEPAATTVTLQTGEKREVYHVCSWHSWQVLAMIRGVTTEMGTVSQEKE